MALQTEAHRLRLATSSNYEKEIKVLGHKIVIGLAGVKENPGGQPARAW